MSDSDPHDGRLKATDPERLPLRWAIILAIGALAGVAVYGTVGLVGAMAAAVAAVTALHQILD